METNQSPTSTVIDSRTITESTLSIAVEQARELINEDCTFRMAITPSNIIDKINVEIRHSLDDEKTIEATFSGMSDDLMVFEVDDHNTTINQKYGEGKLTIGHEFWLTYYGAEAVDNVVHHAHDDLIKATLFSKNELTRQILDAVEATDHKIHTNLLSHTNCQNLFKWFVTHHEQFIDPNQQPNTHNETNSTTTDEENTSKNNIPFSEDPGNNPDVKYSI